VRRLLAVVPAAAVLAVDPGGLAPFGPAKWLVLTTLVLAAGAWVALDRPLRVAPRPTLAWLAFLAVAALAAAFGLDHVYAWTGTPERHLGVVAWVLCFVAFVAAQSGDEGEGRGVALGAVVAAGAVGAWATAEALGWHPLDLVGAGSRPVGTLGSSAYLGAATALLAPVAVGVAADARFATATRRLAGVAAALAGVALVASGARAAWVGSAVALVVLALVRRPSRRWLAGGAVALVLAVAVAGLGGVAHRAGDAFTDRDGGARGRLDEWRVAARVVAEHPLLGTGPEGYRLAFGTAVDDAYERAHGRRELPDRAHDALLDVAATTGVVGLAAYLALLALTGGSVLRALRREPWLAGIAAGLVAYAAQSLFLFPLAEVDPVAWLLAGVLVARVAATREVRTPLAVPAVAGALAAVALVAGCLDVAADHLARGDDVARAAELRPDQLRYHLAVARAEEANGSSIALDRAIAQLDDALDVSPRDPVVRSERARLLLDKARRSGQPRHARAALAALEDLARDDPRNAVVLLRLGAARTATGDDEGAERAWLRAEDLAPASAAASTDLAFAYERAGRTADARAAARRALARQPDGPDAERLRDLAGT
jgi:O-antigen ligase/Flp pilus assembly protein TadD